MITAKYNNIIKNKEQEKEEIKTKSKEEEELSNQLFHYFKSYIINLEEFKSDCDIINIILNDQSTYTKTEVRRLIQEFKNKRVQ